MQTFLTRKQADNKFLAVLVAATVFVSGLLSLIKPLTERLPDRLTDFLQPIDASGTHSVLFTVFGLGLIYLGYELIQRKLAAWWLTLVLSSFNLGHHILVEPQLLQITVAALAFTVLLIAKPLFHSRLQSDNVWRGIRVLLSSVSFALIYGTLGFWQLDKRDLGVEFSLGQAFVRTIREYLLLGNADLLPHTRFSRWFLHSIAIVGLITLAYSLFSLFRPLRRRLRILPGERAKARTILEKYGGETDDFFKLWPPDKSYFFSSDDQAFVAYGVANGVALCFAGPVGAPGSIAMLLDQFKIFCVDNGLILAFVQSTDRFEKQLRNSGFKSLLIGADAVIDIDKFLNGTARNKYFRNINNRFTKQAFTTHYYESPHSTQLINQIREVSTDWQQRSGRKQWRFFTGFFSDVYLQQTPIFVVRDAQGKLQAFVNELPIFKKGEVTIDLMRHRQGVPSNVMDFLFVELMKFMQPIGYKKFNLGLSPIAGKEFADTPADKFLNFLYNSNQKVISFKGLHRYKSKFEPQWEPRYLYWHGGPARLAQIGLAVAKLIRY